MKVPFFLNYVSSNRVRQVPDLLWDCMKCCSGRNVGTMVTHHHPQLQITARLHKGNMAFYFVTLYFSLSQTCAISQIVSKLGIL
jgi:hypothetical protein